MNFITKIHELKLVHEFKRISAFPTSPKHIKKQIIKKKKSWISMKVLGNQLSILKNINI